MCVCGAGGGREISWDPDHQSPGCLCLGQRSSNAGMQVKSTEAPVRVGQEPVKEEIIFCGSLFGVFWSLGFGALGLGPKPFMCSLSAVAGIKPGPYSLLFQCFTVTGPT